MIYAIKNKDDIKDLEEIDYLQSKVKQVRLFGKLGKQGYHYDIKELFEPVNDTIKNISEDITKTITETSIENNKKLENINENFIQLMNKKGMIEQYLASSLVNLFEPENKNHFKSTKELNSTKMNDVLIHGNITVTLYSNIIFLEMVRNLLNWMEVF